MKSTDEGPFPEPDRVPAAHDSPVLELEDIGRTLDDLSPTQKRQPPRNVRFRLIWAAAALAALVVFMGWLLTGR